MEVGMRSWILGKGVLLNSNEKLRIKNAKRNDSNAFSDFDALN
jgi:hypothetical protein